MSERFRFRLDAALRQRERQEQAAQLAVLRVMRRRQTEVTEVERLHRQLSLAVVAPARADGRFDGEARLSQLLFMDRGRLQLLRQQQVLAQWEAELSRLAALLRQASARKKALERLRERRRAEYDLDAQRRQDREADEMVTLRFGRSTHGGGNRDDAFAG
jgi:flagellar FliJ protein